MSLTFDVMKQVNAEVNSKVIYTPDIEQWGVDDRWEDALETGKEDCEGYAIAKLRRLLALRWDRAELKVGMCYVEPFRTIDAMTGLERDATMAERYHAVLVVTCDGDDWILDNRHPNPVLWTALPYSWVRFYLLGARKWRKAA